MSSLWKANTGMALPFVATIPGFSEILEGCLNLVETNLRERLHKALFDITFPETDLNETELAQPALFALQYSIATSLSKFGINPKVAIGHGLGEITAACLADALNLGEAVRFVTIRGKAMQACPEGLMLSVNCDAETIQTLVKQSNLPLYLAAINTPESCVVGGQIQIIQAFQNFLGNKFLSCLLKNNRAFHTPLIAQAIREMEDSLENISSRPIHLPIALNATGQILDAGKTFTPKMFLYQAQNPVRFAEGLAALTARFPDAILVELGPGRTLSSMAASMNLNALPLSLSRNDHSGISVLNGIGKLWTIGYPVMLSALCKQGKRIHLPTYPFLGPKWMAPEAAAGLRTREKERESTQQVLFTQSNQSAMMVNRDSNQEVSVVLANLWKELLNHNELDDHSDFFELGGDSLLLVGLIRRVNRAFNIEVSPRSMVSAKTLRNQTLIIRELLGEPAIS